MFPRLEVHRHLLRVLGFVGVRFLIGHRNVLQNLLDVRFEAHVDHTVGFVQDEVGAATEHQVAVLQHVYETTGRCYDDLLEEEKLKTFMNRKVSATW